MAPTEGSVDGGRLRRGVSASSGLPDLETAQLTADTHVLMTGRALALAVITAVVGLSARSAVAARSDFFYVNIRQVTYGGGLFRVTADCDVQPPWLLDVQPDMSTGRAGQIRAQAQRSPRLEYDDANDSRLGLTERNAADACQLPSAQASHPTPQNGSPRLRGQAPCHCIHPPRRTRLSAHVHPLSPISPSLRQCSAPPPRPAAARRWGLLSDVEGRSAGRCAQIAEELRIEASEMGVTGIEPVTSRV
jgi:hypothetical protein